MSHCSTELSKSNTNRYHMSIWITLILNKVQFLNVTLNTDEVISAIKRFYKLRSGELTRPVVVNRAAG